ncbi:glycine zipper 2TM domain-containing protein [Massilia sp. TSP1-1-2]|uniref:glycine zipper 2TM domain-containing protein n=1 Tax=Massilia sp. TSP1-1-2 TaxID=2804649 RepID=UPI003CFA1976
MTKRPYLAALLLTSVMGAAHAGPQQQQYAADSREAASRYAEDRAICADERNQGQRMKCLRTAKHENTVALAQAKSRMSGNQQRSNTASSCIDCGRVTAVNVSEKRGESNALGVVAGGAAGALLGHQVGGGRGKDLATIAGAVGGAYAGKKLQESHNATKVWTVEVQYDNGQRGSFSYDADPGVQSGDRVQKAGQAIKRI